MSKARFHITYAIVTEESVTHGDSAYHGFMTRNETCPRRRFNPKTKPASFSLRDAVRICQEHDSGWEGVHADSGNCCASNPPRWLSFSNYPGYMSDKGTTELNLHLDGAVTGASAVRISRLLGLHPSYLRQPGCNSICRDLKTIHTNP